MEQVEVEITGMVITQRYGTLNTGDILRTDAAYAKHLVEEAHGARYTSPKADTTEALPEKAKRAKAGKPAEQSDAAGTPVADTPATPAAI